MTRLAFGDARFYLNRQLEWLAFNRRVLEEARDPGNPRLDGKTFSVEEHLMDLASGYVNGSGRHRQLHLGITCAQGEQAVAPRQASETSELEKQDSADATV